MADRGELGWKVMGLVSAVGAGFVAKKVVTVGWKAVTGNEPPTNPEDPEVTWQEAVGFAVVSGAVLGLARMLASRQAASAWHRATGSLPPGLREVS